MAVSAKEEKRIASKVYSMVSLVTGLVLLVVGFLCWNMGSGVVSMVNSGLVDQKVYFPAKGPALDATVYPDAQQYAGQQVVDGASAKAYADTYLTPQIKAVGGGKTLSEVTAAAAADPTNPQLLQLQGVMFQLETSKAIMLTSGYGAASQGMLMETAGFAALAGGAVLVVLAGALMMRSKQ